MSRWQPGVGLEMGRLTEQTQDFDGLLAAWVVSSGTLSASRDWTVSAHSLPFCHNLSQPGQTPRKPHTESGFNRRLITFFHGDKNDNSLHPPASDRGLGRQQTGFSS